MTGEKKKTRHFNRGFSFDTVDENGPFLDVSHSKEARFRKSNGSFLAGHRTTHQHWQRFLTCLLTQSQERQCGGLQAKGCPLRHSLLHRLQNLAKSKFRPNFQISFCEIFKNK